MRVIFDFKLLQHIRYQFKKVQKEGFYLFGHKNSEEILIVAGWFGSDDLLPPLGDSIQECGRLLCGEQALGSCFAWSDAELIKTRDPLKFLDVSNVHYIDTRLKISELFVTIFLAFDAEMNSSKYCITSESLDSLDKSKTLDLRDTEMSDDFQLSSVLKKDSPILVSQLITTENSMTESHILGPARTVVGMFPKNESLGKCLRAMMGEVTKLGDVHVSHDRGYLHIPTFTNVESENRIPKLGKTDRLTNAHMLVRNHPWDAIISLSGYEYFHYSIDGEKDSGWGCAYRSIQTMISWFLNNSSFIDRVLSIIDMQRLLRRVDYAHSDLEVGSNRWIGCMEASNILSDISHGKISCRILHANSILELKRFIFDDVQEHLVEIGSPAMIGAGDYAYTIIGVSSESGSILVLDPHFNGADSHNALSKGYIGWMNVEKLFRWSKISSGFINICLPFYS